MRERRGGHIGGDREDVGDRERRERERETLGNGTLPSDTSRTTLTLRVLL